MRAVYYLKILLLFLLLVTSSDIGFNLVAAGTIARYADAVTRKILMARSLPFEDCGK